MNSQTQDPIQILKRLKAAEELAVIAEVTLQKNSDTGEQFTSIKVEGFSSQPVVTSGGRTRFIKPFAWLTDDASNFNQYQKGQPVRGRIIKVPSNPYEYEVTGDNGKITSIMLDHSWEFLPADLAGRVQSYVPKRFRQASEPVEDVPMEAEVFETDDVGF